MSATSSSTRKANAVLALAVAAIASVGVVLAVSGGSPASADTPFPLPTTSTPNIVASPGSQGQCSPYDVGNVMSQNPWNSGNSVDLSCEQNAIASLQNARAQRGYPAYAFPSDFTSETVASQMLFLVDSDRALFGIAPVNGYNAWLNTSARNGASAGSDPSVRNIDGGTTPRGGAANEAHDPVDPSPLFAYYKWMYDDGAGSPNISCTTPTDETCWDHRSGVLLTDQDSTDQGMLGVGVANNGTDPAEGTALAIAFVDQPKYATMIAIVNSATEVDTTTTVDIAGSGFGFVQEVDVAGVSVPFTVTDTQDIVATLPAGSGPVAITVVTKAFPSGTSTSQPFTYAGLPAGATAPTTPPVTTPPVTTPPVTTPPPPTTTPPVTTPPVTTPPPTTTPPTSPTPTPTPTPTGSTTPPGGGLITGYIPITPLRFLDTRTGDGAAKAEVAGGHTLAVQIAGRGGIPLGTTAVSITVSVISATSPGYVTVYPYGITRPTTSVLNYQAGQMHSNWTVEKLASNGYMDIYNGSGGYESLVIDVSGYYGSSTAALNYVPITPVRLLDTRIGNGAREIAVAPLGTLNVQIAGRGGVPVGTQAVAINVTEVGDSHAGTATVYPYGTTRPGAYTVLFDASHVQAGFAVVKVASNGYISIYNSSTGAANYLVDVAGYYNSTSALKYTPISPIRFEDTRTTLGGHYGAVAKGGYVNVPIDNRGGVPAGTKSVAVIITETGCGTAGWLSAYAYGASRPGTSNVNWYQGVTAPNFAVVNVASNGYITIYNGAGSATNVIVDVVGYYR